MLGVIERIKNAVLFKCNALNEKIIQEDLISIIDSCIYHFAEDVSSVTSDFGFDEEKLRDDISSLIKTEVEKKIKRKLFIDSLALQITNDTFVEDYILGKINMDDLKKSYLKELSNNKNSNQLNMTEDLDMSEIFKKIYMYYDMNIKPIINENNTLTVNVEKIIKDAQEEMEEKLKDLISNTDGKYMELLIENIKEEDVENNNDEKDNDVSEDNDVININEKAVDDMLDEVKKEALNTSNNDFDKYDDMTLFNKVLLGLNTKEEKLSRKSAKLEERRKEIEGKLEVTNKNIEANIQRENELSLRKLKLNEREIMLNSKLAETEVILLNIKPLIKGLNDIKSSNDNGGNSNE